MGSNLNKGLRNKNILYKKNAVKGFTAVYNKEVNYGSTTQHYSNEL